MGDLFDDQLANFHEPLPELSSLKTAQELDLCLNKTCDCVQNILGVWGHVSPEIFENLVFWNGLNCISLHFQ